MSLAKNNTPEAGGLALLPLLIYGLPALAFAFPLIPFAVYLPTYYAEDKALGFTVVAVALFLSRLVDMVSDPLVGSASDRTPNALIRRKGWMTAGAFVAGIALVQLCLPPASPSPLYLGGWSAVLYVGWTMVMIPYQAWGADLASNETETTRFTTAREAFSLAGMVCALAVPLFYDGQVLALIPMLLIPVGVVTMGAAFLYLPSVGTPDTSEQETRASLWQIARAPQMRAFGSIWFLTATASAIPAALFPLYVSDVLKGTEGQEETAILIYFAAAVIAMPLWAHTAKERNKKRIMANGMAVVCAAFPFAALLGPDDVFIFYAVCVVTGCALAAELALGPAVLADIAKERGKLGHQEVASHFAVWGMISKFAFAFAILLAFGALGVSESVFSGAVPPLIVAGVYAVLPTLLKAAATYKLWQISAHSD